MVFHEGATAYIIENQCRVTPVTIIRKEGSGFYTARFTGRRHGAVRLRANRFYPSEEEARRQVLYEPGAIGTDQYLYDNSHCPYGI